MARFWVYGRSVEKFIHPAHVLYGSIWICAYPVAQNHAHVHMIRTRSFLLAGTRLPHYVADVPILTDVDL